MLHAPKSALIAPTRPCVSSLAGHDYGVFAALRDSRRLPTEVLMRRIGLAVVLTFIVALEPNTAEAQQATTAQSTLDIMDVFGYDAV